MPENFFDSFQPSFHTPVVPMVLAVDLSDPKTAMQIHDAITPLIQQLKRSNCSLESTWEYRVAVLDFSPGARSYSDSFQSPADWNWCPLRYNASRDLVSGIQAVDQLLSGEPGWLEPIVCWITDGAPNDGAEAAARELLENSWYQRAKKWAFVIGGDCPVIRLLVAPPENIKRLPSAAGLCFALNDILPSARSQSFQMSLQPDFSCSDGWGDFDSDQFGATTVLEPTTPPAMAPGCASPAPSIPAPPTAMRQCSCGAYAPADRRFCPRCGASFQDMPFTQPHKDIDTSSTGSAPTPIVPPSCARKGTYPCSTGGAHLSVAPTTYAYKGTYASSTGSSPFPVAPPTLSQVQFSAVVPKRFVKGEYAMVELALYEEHYRHIVDKLIKEADGDVKEAVGSAQEVRQDAAVRIVLSSPDLELDDCDETQIWKGKYLTFSFPVEVPQNYAKKQILFCASVYFDGVIATKLKFIAKCWSLFEQKVELSRQDVLTSFVSYASQDRARVATIIQGMQKARPDMDIFFDVESLRSGEDWQATLMREIQRRDILFLCWSEYAKASQWVETEWRYALSNKGLEAIEPIPLVSPSVCPPPEELSSKHFNDKALLYQP